jgi:hypothetical protein
VGWKARAKKKTAKKYKPHLKTKLTQNRSGGGGYK